ncbi:MAG: ferritin-like domain-containing protein [Hymenobacteraceae bacterium]|nr:ferritin-like domain-containing protein [Hymenobacteraceae bacterium]
MSHMPSAGPEQDRSTDILTRTAVDRRSFLRYTGATAVVGGLVLAGCKKDADPVAPPPPAPALTKTLTNDDFGILNYAYALEQLEAAFYTKVVADAASLFSGPELDILKAIRDHEIIHREFFKAALGDKRLVDLTPDYTANGDAALAINFSSKASILNGARLFEDTGVQAYNGAGKFIKSATYLLLAGKIVSVEARHAALLRDMIAKNSFAAKVSMPGTEAGLTGLTVPAALNAQGLDMSAPPSAILPVALKFVKERAQLISQLP